MNHLPGLDSIRFYAAISVVAVHAYANPTIGFLNGWNAVTLFFVLSGYLISYRLLIERRRRGAIDLKAFYIRRELRILPLYFLIVAFGGILLPFLGAPAPTQVGLISMLALAPQIGRSLSDTSLGVIGHLWSIGTEEWFYLWFPLLMRHISFPKLCRWIAILSIFIGGLAYVDASTEVNLLLRFMRFECMAIGGLAAWAVITRSRWLTVIYHPAMQIAVLFALGCVILFDLVLPLHDVFFSLLVAIFLVNVSTNPNSLVKLEYGWSKRGGELTYGIYVWHLPLIWVLEHWFVGMPLLVASIVLTLVVATVSYRFIERPILAFKDRLVRRPVYA